MFPLLLQTNNALEDSGSLSNLHSISPWDLDSNPVELINV